MPSDWSRFFDLPKFLPRCFHRFDSLRAASSSVEAGAYQWTAVCQRVGRRGLYKCCETTDISGKHTTMREKEEKKRISNEVRKITDSSRH